MKTINCSLLCISFLLIGHLLCAAEAGTKTSNWWAKEVPVSGFVPADENPDFDKYMSMSAPVRKGKDGKFVTDEVTAKGWDKTLRTFYMTLDVKSENPIRVHIPEIPTKLPAKGIKPKKEPEVMLLHSDCKVLEVIDGELLEVSGKVGLAVSMGTIGYIVGLPGSRLDVTAFTEKSLPLAGRKWRATSKDRAFIVITPNGILLENVSEHK